jgi:hypothetical protein
MPGLPCTTLSVAMQGRPQGPWPHSRAVPWWSRTGVGLVRRLAALAGKPQRSSATPHMGKDLTCGLHVRTL